VVKTGTDVNQPQRPLVSKEDTE